MESIGLSRSRDAAIGVVRDELAKATGATKCHGCGCLLHAIEALANAAHGVNELSLAVDHARRVVVPKKYDCLGCGTCHAAIAVNAFAEAFPDVLRDAASCPTEVLPERSGWPPLPGDYSVIRFRASVAVCTLNSQVLMEKLTRAAPDGLAIVGTMRTENLGIERVIRNVLANPNIRFLVLCGDDTHQQIGHLPGQSMESLFANGLDETQRIIGAKGKRPFLKNVSNEQILAFKSQVRLVSMIGEQNADRVARTIMQCNLQRLPPFTSAVSDVTVETIPVKEPQFYKSDPAGFFVVYPERRAKQLVVEHYTNGGILDCIVEGATPSAIYAEIVKRGLISQLDHAAYLGRELANAERSLKTGERYVQDRAPGKPLPAQESDTADSCGPTCTTCH